MDRRRCSNQRVDPVGSLQGLSNEQARAAKKILASHDFVTLFRGGAGTGKTHTLKEVERAIAGTGQSVMVLAPQRQQVQDLEGAGLRAQTLAYALATKQFSPYSVVILDEAGQVGVHDMRDLLEALQSVRGRLIVSGDTRQHGAVAAGDALRWIEQRVPRKYAAELRTIRRQNPKLARSNEEKRFIRGYRAAVKEAAAGDIAGSYDRLEKLGCVCELPDEPRRTAIAGEYLTALRRGERPLVVAQTWSEVHAANDAIRSALESAGMIGKGKTLTTYQPVDRTEAQKRDARFYEAGQALFFLRRYGRHTKGEVCEVAGADERGVIVVKDGRRSRLGYGKANSRSVEGARLHNGELVTVARVEPTGDLVITDERGTTKTLAESQRLFVRGYAVTSYASQGKTADTVIVADAGNRPATNLQQWYVSISRGRKRVVVLTPDKLALRENIQRSGKRELALEEGPKRAMPEREFIAWHARRRLFREHAIRHEFVQRQEEQREIRHNL